MLAHGPGKLELVFTPTNGEKETREVYNFTGPGVGTLFSLSLTALVLTPHSYSHDHV